jgi:hypothetical protein
MDTKLQNISGPQTKPAKSSNEWIAAGIFLLVLAIYVLSSPGRIDIIDGQARYDVAYNWLLEGRPVLRDPWIGRRMGVPGLRGLTYSFYGAPASLFSMPLVWLGLLIDVPPGEPSRFLFSLTSPIFGALIAVILFLFYVDLGLGARRALVWTMVNAFTTLIWPVANSTFDNAQHAFFATFAVYLGYLGARHKSSLLAAAGGMAAGVLILYQEYFILVAPFLAISTLDWTPAVDPLIRTIDPVAEPHWTRLISHLRSGGHTLLATVRSAFCGSGKARESSLRFLFFLAGITIAVVLWFVYNDVRFGSYFQTGKFRRLESHMYPPLFGSPLSGFLTLLISPGKSVFLYSPPIILAVWGMRYLRRRAPQVAFAIIGASTMLVLFISCISFKGGDWCWGPRYLVVLLPLWALAFPFVKLDSKVRRNLLVAILGLGLLVQGLALSIENQRFFFERGLNDFFWAEDPWCYFKYSALFARFGEVMSLKDGVPPTAQKFNTVPIPDWSTYAILGPPPSMPRRLAPQWMRQFKIFYLPRPWPIWMWWVKPDLRPINLEAWLGGLLGVMLLGVVLILRGLHSDTGGQTP